MSKNINWDIKDLQKKGLVSNAKGDFVPVKSLVDKGKVDKLPTMLDLVGNIKNHNPIGNKKIKNANKSVVDGVKFDSNLERYMYDLLTGAQIAFEFQKKYILQEKFRYNDEAVRPITLTIDFYLPTRNMLIDTKGIQTHEGAIKHKMLKNLLKHIHDEQPRFELPSTKTECDLLLNRLLYEPAK